MAKKMIEIDELVLYSTDFSSYKTELQKIDGDGTKRNLQGDMRRQVIARKIKIITKTKEFLNEDKMKSILDKIDQDTMLIGFWNTKKKAWDTMECYCSTPDPEIDDIDDSTEEITYKALSIDFIEL